MSGLCSSERGCGFEVNCEDTSACRWAIFNEMYDLGKSDFVVESMLVEQTQFEGHWGSDGGTGPGGKPH
ncbi:unnamed protein product [Protopolystoma xenopodis]|uniref:Uncharacterized protein n=1 Tax=Protopolystoma xenopodis TaxID=117903 RepID=A0A3S5FES5_9PLAT|nr:unnamed protein product [Protopolystoma xenopodis]